MEMEINFSELLERFNKIKTQWDKYSQLVAKNEQFLKNLGVGVDDVSRAIDDIIILIRASENENIDNLCWHLKKGEFKNNISKIESSVSDIKHDTNIFNWLDSNIDTLCSCLFSIKSILRQMLPDALKSLKKQVQEDRESIKNILDKLCEQKNKANVILADIKEFTDETKSKITNINDNHEKIINEKKRKFETLYLKIEEEASKIITIENQAGLAGSFVKKSNELETKSNNWRWRFILGLTLLFLTGVFPLFSILKTNAFNTTIIFNHIIIAAPIFWFTWFSASQYMQVTRIREDYSYKAAAAMAFNGYKEEVEILKDPELHKQLLGLAIYNFGKNPVDLLMKHGSAASPIHEALDRGLKQLDPKQISDLITNIISTLKK